MQQKRKSSKNSSNIFFSIPILAKLVTFTLRFNLLFEQGHWLVFYDRLKIKVEGFYENFIHFLSDTEKKTHGGLGVRKRGKNMKCLISPLSSESESYFLKQLKGFLKSCSYLNSKIKPRMKRG